MTVGLEDQIRDYAHNVHETEMPLTVYEITEMRLGTESVRPIGLPAQSVDLRPRQRWLVAVTSAAAVLLLVGGTAFLTQTTRSDTSAADTVVPTTIAAAGTAAQGEDAAASVTGDWKLKSITSWQGPCPPRAQCNEGRIDMSDERISGEVTFTHYGDILRDTGKSPSPEMYLYWGTMVLENDGGTWEGTHFGVIHNAQASRVEKPPIVMQLVGSGDYEGLSAILYTGPWDDVDGMIFPGDLPPDRIPQ